MNDDGVNLYVESSRYELFIQDVGAPGLVFNGTFHGELEGVLDLFKVLVSRTQGTVALEDVSVEDGATGRVVWDDNDQ